MMNTVSVWEEIIAVTLSHGYCYEKIVLYTFRSQSQNCEKLLLASSCLSIYSHGTTQLPLERFLWNLIFEHFSKICWESSFIKIWQKFRYFTWRPIYIFDHISLNFLWNEWCLDQSCGENQTHVLSCNLWYNVEKYGRARQATEDNIISHMCLACTHSELFLTAY
jgi:hypothetical protein